MIFLISYNSLFYFHKEAFSWSRDAVQQGCGHACRQNSGFGMDLPLCVAGAHEIIEKPWLLVCSV